MDPLSRYIVNFGMHGTYPIEFILLFQMIGDVQGSLNGPLNFRRHSHFHPSALCSSITPPSAARRRRSNDAKLLTSGNSRRQPSLACHVFPVGVRRICRGTRPPMGALATETRADVKILQLGVCPVLIDGSL